MAGSPAKKGQKRPLQNPTSPTTRKAARVLRLKGRRPPPSPRTKRGGAATVEEPVHQPRNLRTRGSPTQTQARSDAVGNESSHNQEDVSSTPRDNVAPRTGSGDTPLLSGITKPNRPQRRITQEERQEREATPSEYQTPPPSQRRNSLQYRQVRTVSPVERATQSSIAALGGEITSSEVRMMRKMMDLHRGQLEVVNSIFAAVSDIMLKVDTLMTDVSDLKLMILQENRGIGRGPPAGASRGKNNSVTELRKEVLIANPTLMREIHIAFGSKVVCRCAARAISRYIDRVHSDNANNTMTSRAWKVILFGLRNNQKKKEFKDGIGLEHANFRFGIARSAVATAKTLTSRAFTVDDEIVSGTSQRSSRDTLALSSSKPSWLMGDFLDKATLRTARMHHECLKSEVPSLPDTVEKRKALYIGKCAVKIVNDMLRLARDRSRIRMFEAGTCFLVDWKSYDCFKDGHTVPNLTFRWPDADPINPEVLQDSAVGMSSETYSRNAKNVDHLLTERIEMVIVADYKVSVGIQTQGRVNKNTKIPTVIRTLKRSVNLLRVALVFLSSFSHCNADALISAHPSMLRTLYRFGLVLRDIFKTRMNELRDTVVESNSLAERDSSRDENRATTMTRSSGAETQSDTVHGSGRQVMRGAGDSSDRQYTDHPRIEDRRGLTTGGGDRIETEVYIEDEQNNDRVENRQAVHFLDHISSITVHDLLPGDTERDRIMAATMKLAHDAFMRLLREGHSSSLFEASAQGAGEELNLTVDSGDDDDEDDIAVIVDDE